MKITTIEVKNFLGFRGARIELERPLALFAGDNYCGKSSLAEAVRMALTGEFARVALKKQLAELVTEGETAGMASVEWVEAGRASKSSVVLPGGAAAGRVDALAAPFVLDPPRFAALDAVARRALLFAVMGVHLGAEDMAKRLIARGAEQSKVARLGALLADAPSAAKQAKSQATEARGAWRAVTGENYGDKKAPTWAAPVPAVRFDANVLQQACSDLAHTEHGIEQAIGKLGELQGAARAAERQGAELASLRANAARAAEAQAKVEHDRAELSRWEAELERTRVAAGVAPAPAPETSACPECGAVLEVRAQGRAPRYELVRYEPKPAPARYDPEKQRQLPRLSESVELAKRVLAKAQADAGVCERAGAALAQLEARPHTPDPAAIAELEAEIARLKQYRPGIADTIRAQENARNMGNKAEADTARARGFHRDVQEWETIASALAPDGIPGEILTAALAPFNERLSLSADLAEWPTVSVEPDMSIRYGGRLLNLCSESERYRAHAMLGEALAYCSGLKLLMLDRFDVLNADGRRDLVLWLAELAERGELGTALLFGMLKALPEHLPQECEGFWIESGIIASRAAPVLPEAVAAAA